MNKNNYTIFIPAYNEENRIEDALKRVYGRGEILLDIRDGSDNTAEIAKKYGAKIIQTPRFEGCDALSDWYIEVFNNIESDYILLWMLSQTHTPDLLDLYHKIAEEGRYKAVAKYQENYCYGVRVNSWRTPYNQQKNISFMFFNKYYVDVSKGVIHNEYPFIGKPEEIYYPPKKKEYCVQGFRDDDASSNDEKHIRYSNLDAIHRYEYGERTNGAKILATFLWQFWLSYIYRGSIFQGVPGLITSIWVACYLGNVQIRIWELQNGWNRDKIIETHRKMKK